MLPVAMALLAAVAVTASAAPDEGGSTAGFDVMAGLLSKIQGNIETTHKVTAAKFDKDMARCNETLRPVQAEVDARLDTMNRAVWAKNNASEAQADLEGKLAPLNEKLAGLQQEMQRMAKRVKEGDADRDEEHHLAEVKAADANAIVAVVTALQSRLAQVNVTAFSFRAVLEDARARVQDSALSGILASAAAAAPKQVVHASDEATVVRLRTLLGLLATELEQYRDSVHEHAAEAEADWKKHRAHLQRRVDELFAEIEATTKAKDAILARIEEEKKVQADSDAVVTGPVKVELATWQQRVELIQEHCDLKRKHFQAEEEARRSQAQTLAALSKLTEKHADSGYDLGIGGIPVPRPSTCCVTCSGDRPAACGDICVPQNEFSHRTCGLGCACSKGDPRLAATQ